MRLQCKVLDECGVCGGPGIPDGCAIAMAMCWMLLAFAVAIVHKTPITMVIVTTNVLNSTSAESARDRVSLKANALRW